MRIVPVQNKIRKLSGCFERDLIRERTQAGLSAARARGKMGGRPKGLSQEAEATSYAAATLYHEGELSIKEILAICIV